jgi:hypothetical protein
VIDQLSINDVERDSVEAEVSLLKEKRLNTNAENHLADTRRVLNQAAQAVLRTKPVIDTWRNENIGHLVDDPFLLKLEQELERDWQFVDALMKLVDEVVTQHNNQTIL